MAQRVLLLRLTPLGLGVRLISPNLFQPRADLESALAPRARRELSSEKAQLRRSFLARREGLPLALVERHSARIIRRFWRLQAAREKGWLSSYVAFAGEIRTRPIIEEALCRGWRVAVPVVSPEPGGALLLSEVKDLEAELRKGRLGIWEPRASAIRPVMPQVIDCFVIPGIAFDRGGRRLGFGQGYYDRLLAGARPDAWRIGLAFSCQMADRIPSDPRDIRMHRVVTEKGVWRGLSRRAASLSLAIKP